MKNKCIVIGFAALALSAVFATAAHARSLLYYYDFDSVDESGNLVVAGVNKGTGAAEPVIVDNNAAVSDSYHAHTKEGGAFSGSGYSIWTQNDRTLWLPQTASDLGCGTTKGFTASMWVKPPANANEWHIWKDFFGFMAGNCYYWLEYSDETADDTVQFRLYGSESGGTWDNPKPTIRVANGAFAKNAWSHLAIVAVPDATNDCGRLALYINGTSVTNAAALGAGVLKQIYIGMTLYSHKGLRHEGDSNTAIDEFALFDYPATAEQIKWLTKHKPAQPTGGPGREMPVCWRFERSSNGKAETSNTGTGDIAVQHTKLADTDVPYTMYGALNTVSAFQSIWNGFTFAAMDDEAGLGATVGSGFSFSFWLWASGTPSEWRDFFGFYLGYPNAIHLEWTASGNPRYFCAYGGSASAPVREGCVASTWQHVVLSYDAANSAVDIYLDGVKRASASLKTPFSLSDTVKRITVGPGSYYYENNTLVRRSNYHLTNTSVDEFAFFNYSISPDEIAWLGQNIPRLPPLAATNLARTVSADCSWAGGLASWSVLDGAGAGTGRSSIYPSCEDTEVEVAVSIAADATIVNDTFVTPSKLKFTNGTGGASAVATLLSGADSMFAPETMEVGEGVTLKVSPAAVSVAQTLTFAQGSKIVFDMSNAGDAKSVKGLSFGSLSLPSGDDDALSYFSAGAGYEVFLSDDGKTVGVKKVNGLSVIVR